MLYYICIFNMNLYWRRLIFHSLFQITIKDSTILTDRSDDTQQLYFLRPSTNTSISFQSVRFLNTKKIIFQNIPEIENSGVNFGKSIVRLDFNTKETHESRVLQKLEITSISCVSNQACVIDSDDTITCSEVSTNQPPSSTTENVFYSESTRPSAGNPTTTSKTVNSGLTLQLKNYIWAFFFAANLYIELF